MDSNDLSLGDDSFSEFGCQDLLRFPNCVPCLHKCVFMMMADSASGGFEWD